MLWQRALVTFTLGPLVLFLIYLGDWYFFVPVAFFLFIALREFARIMAAMDWHVSVPLLTPLILLQYIAGRYTNETWMLSGLALTFLVLSLRALWQYEKDIIKNVTASWAASLTTFLVLGWVGSHVFWLRYMPIEDGWKWATLGILGTWFADTAAYLFGRSFGKHKMTPRLSPKKSWEGYIAGAVLTLIVGGLAAVYLLDLPLLPSMLLLTIIGTVSPAGDLAMSLLKRESGIKDSGNFLPGHGGALDRIDTVLWSAMIAYYLVNLLV